MVTVPRGRKLSAVRRVESDVHHADLAAHEVIGGVTSPLRTVIDCARALPFDAALAVADSALRSGRITKSELVAAAGRAPRTGRTKALRVAKFADPRADNPFESVLRAIAIERGLRLTPQLCCHEFIHADLGSNELRLAVEAESWSYHGDRGAFEADVRRYSLLVREAWVVIRFVWYDVMFRQDHVGEALVSVASRCAARPAVVSEHAS